ncbi:unnamed protein product [Sphagnum jensenii]|uniref:Uncharacterized protein n=1 Tax=Sphagnum jensenii TaxID=128206 RepID=A0ABP0V5G8_9BRYO
MHGSVGTASGSTNSDQYGCQNTTTSGGNGSTTNTNTCTDVNTTTNSTYQVSPGFKQNGMGQYKKLSVSARFPMGQSAYVEVEGVHEDQTMKGVYTNLVDPDSALTTVNGNSNQVWLKPDSPSNKRELLIGPGLMTWA